MDFIQRRNKIEDKLPYLKKNNVKVARIQTGYE